MYFIVLLFVFLAVMAVHSIFYGEEGIARLSSLIDKIKDFALSLPFISWANKVAESSAPHGDDHKENDFTNQKTLPCIKHNQRLNLNKQMHDNKPASQLEFNQNTKNPNFPQKIYKKAVKADDLNKNTVDNCELKSKCKCVTRPNIHVNKWQKKNRST